MRPRQDEFTKMRRDEQSEARPLRSISPSPSSARSPSQLKRAAKKITAAKNDIDGTLIIFLTKCLILIAILDVKVISVFTAHVLARESICFLQKSSDNLPAVDPSTCSDRISTTEYSCTKQMSDVPFMLDEITLRGGVKYRDLSRHTFSPEEKYWLCEHIVITTEQNREDYIRVVSA